MASYVSCCVLVLCLLAESSRAAYLEQQNPASNGFSPISNAGGNGGGNGGGFGGGSGNNGGFNGGYGSNGGGDPITGLANVIPGDGVPGEDYPILSEVPDTGFTCESQQLPGYYADTNQVAGCQVFHICQEDGRQDSFLCPNGTIFNQQYFVCDWWFNFDCSTADQFFGLNADIGKVNGNGNGYNNGNGNGSNGNGNGNRNNGNGNRNNGNGNRGSPSASYGAPTTNGNGGSNNGNRNGGTGNNGNGGNTQRPSSLYQSPN